MCEKCSSNSNNNKPAEHDCMNLSSLEQSSYSFHFNFAYVHCVLIMKNYLYDAMRSVHFHFVLHKAKGNLKIIGSYLFDIHLSSRRWFLNHVSVSVHTHYYMPYLVCVVRTTTTHEHDL